MMSHLDQPKWSTYACKYVHSFIYELEYVLCGLTFKNILSMYFSTPSFTPFNSQNSAAIPACFVLKLNKPMPMCVTLLREIQQLTELEIPELSTATHPLLSLIATHASNGKLEAGNNKGLFVVS